MSSDSIKTMVREKYGTIAKASETKKSSCCSSGCCGSGEVDYTVFSQDYSKLDGYVPEADLGLGCGIPVESTKIKKGATVIDLGSGAGNDCFIVRRMVGETGYVIGIDMTEEMIGKAKKNNAKMGYDNVEFRLGEIEKLPVDDAVADVVISNCVLNLVPDKRKAFGEIIRVLKKDGHFNISDIVIEGELPAKLRTVAELYAGCISGAVSKKEYLQIIKDAGFGNISISSEKNIDIPDDLLLQYMNEKDLKEVRSSAKIVSITVYGEKS